MHEQLKKAHLCICRAGASTIAENMLAGRPALYVPFPHAKHDHQLYNAKRVCKAGAGWLYQEGEAYDKAKEMIVEIVSNPAILPKKSVVAKQLAVTNADEQLADVVLKYARND